MNIREELGKLLIPLIVDYAAGRLATWQKRILFLNVSALSTESLAWLQRTATELDEKLIESIIDEAKQELGAELVEQLDGLVEIPLSAA